MKKIYANEFIQNTVLGDPTTCVYQLIYDENYSSDTTIIQYFILNKLRLCIKFNSFVSHMLYAR